MSDNSTATASITNETTTAIVSLRFEQSFSLPSQEGKRGRPRSRGRAYVRPEIEGVILDANAVRESLASFYSLSAKDIAFYRREDVPGALLVFIVPGVDKDTGHTFIGAPGALGGGA